MARNSFYSGDAGADVTIDNSVAQAQLAENNAAASATAAASSATGKRQHFGCLVMIRIASKT